MTYIPEKVDISKFDAFGRMRVSDPHTLFESQMQFDEQPLLWETITTGAPTSIHIPYQSSLSLDVTTTGDKIFRETYEKFRYQPGKSQLIFMTGVLGTNSGGIKRVGYFNDDNGIFYEQHPTEGLRFGIRSNVSDGSTVTHDYVNQSSWNIDTFNDIDPSKSFIIVIDMEWLGMGTVRVGFVHNGAIRYVHSFHHANLIDTVYMATANLPCRYEIEYSTGADSLLQTCTTVISEGGFVNKGIVRYVDTGTTSRDVSTETPVVSIKLKDAYAGAQIIPETCDVLQTSNSTTVRYRIVVRNTLTGASWTSVDSESSVEYDISATSSSGGIVIAGGFLPPKSPIPIDLDFSNMPPLCTDYNNNNMILSVLVEGIGGSAPIYSGIRFRELK